MEQRRRNTWIIVIVVVAVVALLACAAVIIGAVLLLRYVPISPGVGLGRVSEQTEQTFPVGQAPTLMLDNFAGTITVRAGSAGQIGVTTTKRAPTDAQLSRIDVAVTPQGDGLHIETSTANGTVANVSVDFVITVPPDAQVQVNNGAGEVRVTGVQGEIQIQTGAGRVAVSGATASVTLNTGAGEITYNGQPQGSCTFDSGAGNIDLTLPADVGAQLDLSTSIGSIHLGGFDVSGSTSNTNVQGTLGGGGQATIEAHTAAGNINLSRQ